MRTSLLAAAFAVTAATASAQGPIGPFTGQYSEGFETYGLVLFTPCMPSGVFSATAQMCTPAGSGCHTTGGWGFMCSIGTHSGGWLFGSAGQWVQFDFTGSAGDVAQFGGYMGTNSGNADATIDFLDANDNLLASTLANVPADCSWNWNGWNCPAGTRKINVTGLNPFGGGYIQMDDLEVNYGSSGPSTYCTAGTTTNGCVPSISASGNPNVAHSNTCMITASNVEGQKSGIVFYGLAQNGVPWCSSGGTSFLCVKPPTQRTPVQSSGGTLNACDGALSLDWNAFQLANPGALGNPWSAGDTADVQVWFRDPPACKTTNLSDAVELTYQP
jgi:hypothetical protein